MRPSTQICLPFCRYWPAISACLPKQTIWCHSVCSCFCPFLSRQRRLVAIVQVATGCPDGRDRTSGSLPRLPIRMTLFNMLRILPDFDRLRYHTPAGRGEVRKAEKKGREDATGNSKSELGGGAGRRGDRGRDRQGSADPGGGGEGGRHRESAGRRGEAGRPAGVRGRGRQDE